MIQPIGAIHERTNLLNVMVSDIVPLFQTDGIRVSKF